MHPGDERSDRKDEEDEKGVARLTQSFPKELQGSKESGRERRFEEDGAAQDSEAEGEKDFSRGDSHNDGQDGR